MTQWDELIAYAISAYGVLPDHPFKQDDVSTVLRHTDTRKWFGLFMRVAGKKIGLQTDEPADVLNVKCDPITAGILRQTPGIMPGYHMQHDHWITIVLNGTVAMEQIRFALDLSYELTDRKKPRPKTAGNSTKRKAGSKGEN